MGPFRGRAARDLTALRQFRPRVAIQDSSAAVGMNNSHGHDLEELPVVLLHGTSGQSEDWSQVVELVASHRSVIRPNYAEPVAGTDSANAPRVSDFADRVVAAARASGRDRFDVVGYSLGAAVATFIAAEY